MGKKPTKREQLIKGDVVMFKMNEITGEQKTYRGDSYNFKVTGIPADWDAFYSVYNIETQEIILEVQSTKENDGDRFYISADESDRLIVPQGKKSAVYGWGVKRKKDGYEDTTIVAGQNEDYITKIIVLPKKTEGSV
jgi:hypothetical protein